MSRLASGFYCGVNKSLPGNVLQLGAARPEQHFREQLIKEVTPTGVPQAVLIIIISRPGWTGL